MSDTPPRTRTIHLDDPDSATGHSDTAGGASSAPGGVPPEFNTDRPRTPTFAKLERAITDLYTQVGFVLTMAPSTQFDGQLIARRAGTLAESWVDLAEKDPKVKRALDSLLKGTGWSGVIGAHVMIALPIAASHGIIPEKMAAGVLLGLAAQDPEFMAPYMAAMTAEQNGNGGNNGN